MPNIVRLRATDGTLVEFINENDSYVAMQNVYLSPDKSYVVGFFNNHYDINADIRLKELVNNYQDRIFNQPDGNYWRNLFCWPTKIVIWDDKIGVVTPTIPSNFIFNSGRFKNTIKEGKWFASAKLCNKFLSSVQKGTLYNKLFICNKIADAVGKLHSYDIAHADLSYKNVLADPESGSAMIIGYDCFILLGINPPEILETPDFIAPEVLQTLTLKFGDPNKKLTSLVTNRHALAVLIYMFLLRRHPLRGGRILDEDAAKDEELSMGEKALFVEHPTDKSNRPDVAMMTPAELPQGDVTKRPYTNCGPYLTEMFNRAFIYGLHEPSKRPLAEEWSNAIIKTIDLLLPCQNPDCEEKWFVFDNSTKPKCPFCGAEYRGDIPILNFYYSPIKGKFLPDNLRLMVYEGQSICSRHISSLIKVQGGNTVNDYESMGYFDIKNGQWVLVNSKLTDMWDVSEQPYRQIKIGESVEITDGQKILLSKEEGGRLIVVQLIKDQNYGKV